MTTVSGKRVKFIKCEVFFMLFPTGPVVMTQGIAFRCQQSKGFYNFVLQSLQKHRNCKWGFIPADDRKLNDLAVKTGDRILSAYKHSPSGETIWIITEWDRSCTTILFQEEY